MKTDQTIRIRRAAARGQVNQKRHDPQGTGNALLDFIDAVASGVKEFVSQPLQRFAKAVEAHSSILRWLVPIQVRAVSSLAAWVIHDIQRKIEAMILVQVDALRSWTFSQLKDAYYVLAVAVTTLRAQLMMALSAETRARIRAVAHAEVQAKTEVRALHQAIENEAATAYQSGNAGHLSAVSIVGDAISAAEPALNHLVSRIVSYAIGLAEVDNPLIRILAGKLISYLIGRLGIDKIAGDMLGGLVSPVLHLGNPKGLPEVVTALCGRLNNVERFGATFMADGGPEILKAGQDWRNIDSPAIAIALTGFFAAMVAAPDQWATTLTGTIGAVVDDAIGTVAKAIGG